MLPRPQQSGELVPVAYNRRIPSWIARFTEATEESRVWQRGATTLLPGQTTEEVCGENPHRPYLS